MKETGRGGHSRCFVPCLFVKCSLYGPLVFLIYTGLLVVIKFLAVFLGVEWYVRFLFNLYKLPRYLYYHIFLYLSVLEWFVFLFLVFEVI